MYVLHNCKIVWSVNSALLYFIFTVCVLHVMGIYNYIPLRAIVKLAWSLQITNLTHNFSCMFISFLYMFRVAMCPSSGELLYQCDTWFMSLCVDDRLVCILSLNKWSVSKNTCHCPLPYHFLPRYQIVIRIFLYQIYRAFQKDLNDLNLVYFTY